MANMKIKAKEKDGIVGVKAMFTSVMADKEEAEKKKIVSEYIAQIIAKNNGVVVFEVTASGFMSENPLFKFSYKGKVGDTLEITTTDNSGKTETGTEKVS
ncbi:MAG: thiosulfate oxidation carrier complex protein SoxZ [Campylobacterales bacterium]|nr:thiosulfate oxidation carrier complex protein SoxZ [Campylobacterales bacterium]